MHENASDQTCLHKWKIHFIDEMLTTSYFCNVIYLCFVALLDFYDFYFFSEFFVINIIINNLFLVGIVQHLKILLTVFTLKKLIKANYQPSRMKVSKDNSQQSFRFHNYWVKRSKYTHSHKYKRTHICMHT